MVGRGGKGTFLVVDFADNIIRFGGGVVRAADVFPRYAGTSKSRPYRPPACHTEPRDIPQFVNHEIPGVGTVTIALGQTFGMEIELTGAEDITFADPVWQATAVKIVERLRKYVTAPVHPVPLTIKVAPLDAWRVTYDSSCGWEVVSPILVDAGGFDELRRACLAITELVEEEGLRVNHRTGLHITLATRLDTDEKLRGFVRFVQRVEPGLFTLVAPSRLYRYDPDTGKYSPRVGNQYCLPLRGLGDPARPDLADFVVKDGNRYHTVNLTKSLVPHRGKGLSRNSETTYLAWSLDCEEIDPWQGRPRRSLLVNGNRSCWTSSASHARSASASCNGRRLSCWVSPGC